MDKFYVLGRDAVPSFLRLGEGEALRMTLVVPEGVSCRLALEVDLDGAGASLDLAGATLSRSDEQVSIQVTVRHNVPGCRSEQLFKSVAGGSSKVAFDGLVYVAQDAVRTVAHQQNHSLLLSESASAESRPQLEIYADDVECSHGATTGYLNPEELFYMRSRGIPEEEARRMQVEAFLAPILARETAVASAPAVRPCGADYYPPASGHPQGTGGVPPETAVASAPAFRPCGADYYPPASGHPQGTGGVPPDTP